jgi:hypothetical protein
LTRYIRPVSEDLPVTARAAEVILTMPIDLAPALGFPDRPLVLVGEPKTRVETPNAVAFTE